MIYPFLMTGSHTAIYHSASDCLPSGCCMTLLAKCFTLSAGHRNIRRLAQNFTLSAGHRNIRRLAQNFLLSAGHRNIRRLAQNFTLSAGHRNLWRLAQNFTLSTAGRMTFGGGASPCLQDDICFWYGTSHRLQSFRWRLGHSVSYCLQDKSDLSGTVFQIAYRT